MSVTELPTWIYLTMSTEFLTFVRDCKIFVEHFESVNVSLYTQTTIYYLVGYGIMWRN